MKTIKTTIVTSLLIVKCSIGFSQKDSSGIYFKANDYINLKLSYAINCKTEKHKIAADMIFHSKEISVKHNGTTYKYQKDSVYAIKYCDGSIVRIYNNSEFPLVNPNETIMLYKVVSGGAKNIPSVTKYYFSKDAKSKIQELTIYNVKTAFPDNHKFHDLLDMEFHSDDELFAYDNFYKMEKINHVLTISKEK
jgi:hypothetical protein